MHGLAPGRKQSAHRGRGGVSGRGWVLFKLGRLDEEAADFAAAVALVADGEAYCHLAAVRTAQHLARPDDRLLVEQVRRAILHAREGDLRREYGSRLDALERRLPPL